MAALAAAVLVASGAGLAGEPPRFPGMKAETDEDKQPESLEEFQRYQSFAYIPGGRDPLTFRIAVKREDAAEPGFTVEATAPGSQVPPEKKRQALREALAHMEMLILSHQYRKAADLGDTVQNRANTDWGMKGPDPDAEVNRLFRRLLSFSRTAKRLLQVQEVQAEFDSLNLTVEGIRWTPSGASTIINAAMYEPGAQIDGIGAQSPVQIESIYPDAVVFIYKGQRFRKSVGLSEGTGRAD